MRIEILAKCITSSILRALLSGFWVSGSQFPNRRDSFTGSSLSGSHVPESQFKGPGGEGLMSRVSESQGTGLQILGSQGLGFPGSPVAGSWVSWSQVLILDYANNIHFNESNSSYIFPIESSRAFPRSYSSNDIFVSPVLVFDWLIFCCKSYILHQKKKLK